MAATAEPNSFLNSSFPVTIPVDKALTSVDDSFNKDISDHTNDSTATTEPPFVPVGRLISDDEISTLVSETADIREGVDKMNVDNPPNRRHPFMAALSASNVPEDRDMSNKMFTENLDVAHASTKEPLVDLFFELEEVVDGKRLNELLNAAWESDPLSTLKIIFNARSIHLGKSSRVSTYKCFGWLAENHPKTLLMNLQWLVRPVIEKKVGEKNKKESEDDMVLVEVEKSEDDPARFDVKNGVAHGYWKDLLNVLALTIDGKLNVLADPTDLLNSDKKKVLKKDMVWDQAEAKKARYLLRHERHAKVVKALEDKSSFYRLLHLTVARLFGAQLKSDLALLRSNDKKAIRKISLCAKWAPSSGLFHDKHTFVVSSIAEYLHPRIEGLQTNDRELYLRHAREAYRKDVSALRKALEVVERDIAAKTFENIKYEKVPSLAMNRYAGLFALKDEKNFDEYISKVADGKKSISGATLLPSTIIAAVRAKHSRYSWGGATANHAGGKRKKGTKALVEAKLNSSGTDDKVLNGQWNTLVNRIKDSGSLDNSIAICDVSGSMCSPTFQDKSCPIDSAIGLSLLLAEVTKPPFGGSFITFSDDPKLVEVTGETLQEKVRNMEGSDWGMSTNFVAVFEQLILPQARKFNIKQEDMVKRVFVFSDMQFNAAEAHSDSFSTSYERIKKSFELYKYEMPELVFWNLAGGRGGQTAPKPVTADEEGTSLVSGYSQGMLKVFLDNGAFEEAEEEVVVAAGEGDDEEDIVTVTKKKKVDPISTVRKAISHSAYGMLKVVD